MKMLFRKFSILKEQTESTKLYHYLFIYLCFSSFLSFIFPSLNKKLLQQIKLIQINDKTKTKNNTTTTRNKIKKVQLKDERKTQNPCTE